MLMISLVDHHEVEKPVCIRMHAGILIDANKKNCNEWVYINFVF